MSTRGLGLGCLGVLLGAAAVQGCATGTVPGSVLVAHDQSPAPARSIVPQVIATARGAALSWLEPRADRGYAFRMAVRRDGAWSSPRTITDSPDVIMFSADLPGLVELPGGALLAYWQHADPQTGDPYATAIHVARSDDDGRTWMTAARPYREAATGQHGFISAFPLPAGAGLVWLDAEKQRYVPPRTPGGKDAMWLGAIGLRAAAFDLAGRLVSEQFIDPITCECCPTAAATTSRGPVVVYRDRVTPAGIAPEDVRPDTGSVRDIHLTRFEGDRWTRPVRVHADNWVVNGCPDNGPAVDARDARVVVAWWTAAEGRPRVSLAFSSDAGDTFSRAYTVDAGHPTGQVTVTLLPGADAAVVGWLEGGQTWARIVHEDGSSSAPAAIGTSPARARLPRWIAEGEAVLAVWTAGERTDRSVRVARLTVTR